MDFEKSPEWEQVLGLLGEVYSLALGLASEEERSLAVCLREAALNACLAVAQGVEAGVLTQGGKKAVSVQLVRLTACLEMAIKLSLGSREANNELIEKVRQFARQLESE